MLFCEKTITSYATSHATCMWPTDGCQRRRSLSICNLFHRLCVILFSFIISFWVSTLDPRVGMLCAESHVRRILEHYGPYYYHNHSVLSTFLVQLYKVDASKKKRRLMSEIKELRRGGKKEDEGVRRMRKRERICALRGKCTSSSRLGRHRMMWKAMSFTTIIILPLRSHS